MVRCTHCGKIRNDKNIGKAIIIIKKKSRNGKNCSDSIPSITALQDRIPISNPAHPAQSRNHKEKSVNLAHGKTTRKRHPKSQ
jgi:hypothetical protein